MRLHRLIGIIMLLDSRKVVKAKDMASILEASERTVYRDVDILCEAGIPIVSISGPAGGFSFVEGYKLNKDSLQQRDVVNILISSMGVKADKSTETHQELRNAIIKLENSVPEEYRKEIAEAKKKFIYDSDPWIGEKESNNYIDIIKNAVFKSKKIKMRYKNYEGEVSERIVRPYGVIAKGSQLYFSAFCEERNEVRSFRIDRVQSIEMLEDSFSMPKEFSLEEFWNNSKKQFIRRLPSEMSINKAYTVKIKLSYEKKDMLRGFQVLNYEKLDGFYIYYINMISFETACSVIFSLSDRIEVLEPKELKKYIIDKAEKIIKRNK